MKMTDQEPDVNQHLQMLSDAYRLGQIDHNEYRLRRRHALSAVPVHAAGITGKCKNSNSNICARIIGVTSKSSSALGSTAFVAVCRKIAPPAASAVFLRAVGKYWLLFALVLLLGIVTVAQLLQSLPN